MAPERIDPTGSTPLHRQIVEALRADILAGRLAPGQRLESSRALAALLGVSRNTVLQAFDQLTAEGYLVGARGSGTYVSRELPYPAPRLTAGRGGSTAPSGPQPSPSSNVAVFERLAGGERRTQLRPFQSGIAALDAFPLDLWRRVASRALAAVSLDDLGYGDPRGYRPLREALAARLWSSRGVSCDADQIFVVGGSQQALDLAARVLLDPGDAVWVEDPGYLGTRAAMVAAGARLVPVALDRDGLRVDHGVAAAPQARLACVTPSHQYPLGTIMGAARRLELLSWAEAAGAWVVEDDYDSEFRYSGRPLPALKSLDDSGRVLYVGTFSKVLFPALRIGYLVVPRPLVRAFVGARFASGRHAPLADQATLDQFIRQGHLARHLKRMKGLYLERQRCLVETVRQLGALLHVDPSEAGMHLVGWLDDREDEERLADRCSELGLRIEPLSRLVLEHRTAPGVLLGYTGFSKDAIRAGVASLAEALESVA